MDPRRGGVASPFRVAHAKQVFLDGCGLPAAWSEQATHTVLDTAFGSGLHFLLSWALWREDAQRSGRLHYLAVAAQAPHAEDILDAVDADPRLAPLAATLSESAWGLLPGWHRLSLDHSRVILTLGVGDPVRLLRDQDCSVDSLFLKAADLDVPLTAASARATILAASARLCRPGARLASDTSASSLQARLERLGFACESAPGGDVLPGLAARFAPRAPSRRLRPILGPKPGRAIVIGAGLAGAAAAAALAHRGWQVEVLDQAGRPASGASGLPAGLLCAPHSPDDNLLCRLARAGLRMSLEACVSQLAAGRDFSFEGVWERSEAPDAHGLPNGSAADDWVLPREEDSPSASTAPRAGRWHPRAGWVKPAALVTAWLNTPGVLWRGHCTVARLERRDGVTLAIDANGNVLAEANCVIVCAAADSRLLLPSPWPDRWALGAVRGQILRGESSEQPGIPTGPINGDGHFIPGVPGANGQLHWFSGSSYVRGDWEIDLRTHEHEANWERLERLFPAARQLRGSTQPGASPSEANAWAGTRCASRDRRPIAGWLDAQLGVSIAMGSRGLSFAALAAETLAAHWHDEPLPAGVRLSQAISPGRFGGREKTVNSGPESE